jgi:hypothetical protein
VEMLIKTESERVYECLDVCTHDVLMASMQDHLIVKVRREILSHDDFQKFIEDGQVEDLKRIYNLFKLVALPSSQKSLFDELINYWRQYVQAKGVMMLNDDELAKKTFHAIEDFIQFREKNVQLIKSVFPQGIEGAVVTSKSSKASNMDIQQSLIKFAVIEGFSEFLNIEPNIVAEYLAKFLDFHLRKSSVSNLSDENLIKIIEDILFLYRIVTAKDIFEEFYQRGLSRRLLLKKSASYESEQVMIQKLKTDCGDTFI